MKKCPKCNIFRRTEVGLNFCVRCGNALIEETTMHVDLPIGVTAEDFLQILSNIIRKTPKGVKILLPEVDGYRGEDPPSSLYFKESDNTITIEY